MCVCVGREKGHICLFVHRGQNLETDLQWTWNLGWGPARRAILWPQALTLTMITWSFTITPGCFYSYCCVVISSLWEWILKQLFHMYIRTHIHAYNKITRDSWWHYFLLLGISLYRRYPNVSEVRVNKRKTGQKWCFICLLHPEHGRDSVKY